jgi:hypothetical protein
MPSAGFESAIPAIKLLPAYAIHRAVTGIGEPRITAINVSSLWGGAKLLSSEGDLENFGNYCPKARI